MKKRIFRQKMFCMMQYFVKYLRYLSFWKFLTFSFNKFLKDFNNDRKKTNRVVVFSCTPFQTFLNTETTDKTSNNLENKIPSDIYWRGQGSGSLFRLTVLFNHHWDTVRTRRHWQIKIHYDLSNHLGSYRKTMQFQISSRRENRQRYTWVIKITVLRKVLGKQFCLIWRKRQHPWAIEQRRYSGFTFVENNTGNSSKVQTGKFLCIDWDFILLAYARLAASRTLLQRLLAFLNFAIDLAHLFCW